MRPWEHSLPSQINTLIKFWESWHAPISPKDNLEIFILAAGILTNLGVKQCIDFIKWGYDERQQDHQTISYNNW